MADDREIVELLYDIQLKGATEAYRKLDMIGDASENAQENLKKLMKASNSSDFKSATRNYNYLSSAISDVNVYLEEGSKSQLEFAASSKKSFQTLKGLYDGLKKSQANLQAATDKKDTKAFKEELARFQLKEKLAKKAFTRSIRELEKQKRLTQEVFEIRKKGLRGFAEEGGEFLGALKGGDVSGLLSSGGKLTRRAGLSAQGKAQEMFSAGGSSKLTAMLSRVGTLLARIGGAVAAFAAIGKILFDAYSQTKELNKAFLETQSLASLIPKNLEGTPEGLAVARMELEKFRNASVDVFTNFKYDLSKEDYAKVISSMTDKGLRSMEALENDTMNVTRLLVDSQIAAKNLGVDVGEVIDFTSTYMDTLGGSLDNVRDALTVIQDDALNSGISTKRFFGIVSQTSNEMGQYNFRIKEASGLLKQISKSMDAKSAEEFMQKLGSGLTNASYADRIKILAMGGKGRVGSVASAPAQRAVTGAFSDMSPDQQSQLMSAIRKNPRYAKASDAYIQKNLVKILGSLTSSDLTSMAAGLDANASERLLKMARVAKGSEGGGALDFAEVAGDFGAIDQVELQIKQLREGFKSSSLYDIKQGGIKAEAMGYDEKTFRQMQAFEFKMLTDFKRLQQMAASGMSPEDFAKQASELGYEGITLGAKGKIMGKGGEVTDEFSLLRAMTDMTRQDLMKKNQGQKSLAEQQIEETRNLTDVIEKGVAYILNKIYNVVSSIYDFLIQIRGSDEERAAASANKKVREAQDELRAAQEDLANVDPNNATKLKAAQDRVAIARANVTRRSNEAIKVARENNSATRKTPVKLTSPDGTVFTRNITSAELEAYKKKGYKADDMLTLSGDMSTQGYQAMGAELKLQNARGSMFTAMQSSKDGRALIDRLREGKASQEDIAAIQAKSLKVLDDTGVKIDAATRKDLAKEMAIEFMAAQQAVGLSKATGMSIGEAQSYLQSYYTTGKGLPGMSPDMSGKADSYVKNLPKAGDARIMRSGVAPLSLKAGDLIVDRNSLAQAKYGPPGTQIPELLRAMGQNPGVRGAANMNQDNSSRTLIFYVKDNQMKDDVLRILEEHDRNKRLSNG